MFDEVRRWTRQHRFGVLLAILLLLLIGTSVMLDLNLPIWWVDGLLALLILPAVYSVCFRKSEQVFAMATGVPSVLIVVAANVLSGPLGRWLLMFGRACQVAFLLGAAVLIVKSLFQQERFTFDKVFGVVCGYLFLGLGWAMIYVLTEHIHPGSFHENETVIPQNDPNRPLAFVLAYFSYITLTTVGFGDILPTTLTSRILALSEAIAGQFYLAVVVAGLVNTRKPEEQTDS